MAVKQFYTAIITLIKANLSYFVPFALLLNIVFVGCVSYDHALLSFPPNEARSFWLNVFFVNYTFMGSWVFALALIAWLYFLKKKVRLATSLLIGFLSTLFIVQAIKNLTAGLGDGIDFYAESGQYLLITPQHTELSLYGLISGYAATAFALATILALHTRTNIKKFLLFLAAALLAFSRIYLGGNSLADVAAGAVAGVSGASMAALLLPFLRGAWKGAGKRMNIEGVNLGPVQNGQLGNA